MCHVTSRHLHATCTAILASAAQPFLVVRLNGREGPQFRKQGKAMVDLICDYYQTVGQHPVRSQVEMGYLRPLLPEQAPEHGEPFQDILRDVQQHILPGRV